MADHPDAYVNLTTSESVEFSVKPITRRTYGTNYYLGMRDKLRQAIYDPDLSNADKVVLHALILELQFGTPQLNIEVSTLARNLNMNRSRVSSSISKLVERGHIVRVPKGGRTYTYYVEPSTAFMGTSAQFEQARRTMNDILWNNSKTGEPRDHE